MIFEQFLFKRCGSICVSLVQQWKFPSDLCIYAQLIRAQAGRKTQGTGQDGCRGNHREGLPQVRTELMPYNCWASTAQDAEGIIGHRLAPCHCRWGLTAKSLEVKSCRSKGVYSQLGLGVV